MNRNRGLINAPPVAIRRGTKKGGKVNQSTQEGNGFSEFKVYYNGDY